MADRLVDLARIMQYSEIKPKPKKSTFHVADGSPIESMLIEAGYEKTQENVYPGWNVWVREVR
jgi:hypothetical protein